MDVENKSYEQALVKEHGMSPAEVIANLQAQLAERQGYIDEQHRLNEQEHQQKVAAQAQNLLPVWLRCRIGCFR